MSKAQDQKFIQVLNAHILIVANERTLRRQIENVLNTVGFKTVHCVEDGQQAIQLLRRQSIDLLISEIDLDEFDGWRLSRLVRSGVLACAADIPVFLVSSIWCERIAEVTGREYRIDKLISLEQVSKIHEYAIDYLQDSRPHYSQKLNLLVIEDQRDTSDLIKRVLDNYFSIDIAFDGQQGLEAWLAKRHDLVLLDVMLPELSGHEVLAKIMTYDKNQAVVVMTAHANGEIAEKLMLEGASDFLAKPFRTDQLRKVCDLAARREDYLISNKQFAERVQSLAMREKEYKRLSDNYQKLLYNLQSVVMELDAELNIHFLNHTWERITGYRVEESIGKSLRSFMPSESYGKYNRTKTQLSRVLKGSSPLCELTMNLLSKKGEMLWVELKVTQGGEPDQPSLTVCMDDITETKKAQEKLEHLAIHDTLTGLHNRRYFETSIDLLATEASQSHHEHGLIYLDLDHFKVVNDTCGHRLGDQVLVDVSKLIEKEIRKSDILCRLGGDEFAVILYDVSEAQLKTFAQAIQNSICDLEIQADKQNLRIGCSIGLSLIDGTAASPSDYLIQADIALYVAKGRGRNLIHLYSAADKESDELRHNINWSQKVRKAIEDNRVVLFFQPIFDISKKEIAYYEALVRIKDIDGSIIYPDSFIPALESIGEMYLLDRWIIKLAIKSMGSTDAINRIAINLSAQAFKDEQLVPTIVECLNDTSVNANAITFELTESASLFNLHVTQRIINELHTLGCSFSIDDFGSGFSSFSYLKQLPADYIKLDGSFIRRLDKDPVDQALVRSIIQVVQSLGKKAVAEFVENGEILKLLEEYGVDYAQGYYIGKPVPFRELPVNISNMDFVRSKN